MWYACVCLDFVYFFFFKLPVSNILTAETSRGCGLVFAFFPVAP